MTRVLLDLAYVYSLTHTVFSHHMNSSVVDCYSTALYIIYNSEPHVCRCSLTEPDPLRETTSALDPLPKSVRLVDPSNCVELVAFEAFLRRKIRQEFLLFEASIGERPLCTHSLLSARVVLLSRFGFELLS